MNTQTNIHIHPSISSYENRDHIFQRVIQQVAASRIQATWRSYLIMKKSSIERELAGINKILNTECVKDANCSDNKKTTTTKSVNIKDIQIVKENDNNLFTEQVYLLDGNEKDTAIFTKFVNQWLCFLGDRENFFNLHMKKIINTPISKYWGDYLQELIHLLNNEESIILWSHNSRHRKIYLQDKKKIIDLKDQWRIYKEKKPDTIKDIHPRKKNWTFKVVDKYAEDNTDNQPSRPKSIKYISDVIYSSSKKEQRYNPKEPWERLQKKKICSINELDVKLERLEKFIQNHRV